MWTLLWAMWTILWGLLGWKRVYRVMVRAGERVRVDEWYRREERLPRQRINHLIHWLENQGFKDEEQV